VPPNFKLAVGVWDPPGRPEERGLFSEVCIFGPERQVDFSKLKRQQSSLQPKMRRELSWEARKDRNHCVVTTDGDFGGWEEQKWPDYYRWFEQILKKVR
jgi:hypothetical protein